jgi:hypothetical protein
VIVAATLAAVVLLVFVAPTRLGTELELRRSQSLGRVRAVLIAEDLAPT